ncbi:MULTISPECIES: signal peptidase I [Sphingomonas]|uniref:signal peptidase I n=1 Tax=Sphingomonas TaxID=13687 RepID=UPI001F080C93|nr:MULTISPECIES: signal peptidase I [Sphingomonas]
MNETATEPPAKKQGNWRSLLWLALFAWLLRSLIVAPFSIPSGSMLPGLYIGDYLIVAKWPYGYSRASFLFGFPPMRGKILSRLPKRGDVAVFQGPQGDDIIKRVIGLPGDTIATRGGVLILDGKPVERVRLPDLKLPVSANTPCRQITPQGVTMAPPPGQDCHFTAYRETLPGGPSYVVLDQVDNPLADEFGPVEVPAGTVFMMGDNRDDSADSRFSPASGGMGFVPLEHLVGRALVTFWSTDGSAEWLKPWTWFTALRAHRIGQVH